MTLLETMNRPGLRRLGRGTLMGNKEHKLQVNLELTHLKRKVKFRVCQGFLSETTGITELEAKDPQVMILYQF